MKYDVDGGILDGSKRWLSCKEYDFSSKGTCVSKPFLYMVR